MLITIDKFILAGKDDAVSGFRKSGSHVIQEQAFFRGDQIETIDRGNKKTVISCSVTRLHADAGAAEVFLLEHDDKVPTQGLVTFTARKISGAVSERYLVDASITTVESSYMGATTFHSYQIVGGILLANKPRL